MTNAGHADLLEATDGSWWAIFLATRTYDDGQYNTGRETFLLPVTWRDGWPTILEHGRTVPYAAPGPRFQRAGDQAPQSGNFTWRDEFEGAALDKAWLQLRTPTQPWFDLKRTPGAVTIDPQAVDLAAPANPSFLARRQQHLDFDASTSLEAPKQAGTVAGLVAFQSERYWFFLGARRVTDGLQIFLEKHRGRCSRSHRDEDDRSDTAPQVQDQRPGSRLLLLLRLRRQGMDPGQGARGWLDLKYAGGRWIRRCRHRSLRPHRVSMHMRNDSSRGTVDWIAIAGLLLSWAARAEEPAYRDLNRTFEARAADLVSRMTLEEKIAQLGNDTPAIPRLEVPAYEWWNEALHGVARAGSATVFPQAIGLAATFDPQLMHEVATAISDEARAKHHEFERRGLRRRYQGLTFWSPNINIFRDPRWGRGQETYGEDPWLTARMGVAFVKGLQGDDPKYRKVDATAKHYAVHSGPEADRHHFDVHPSERDLYETYLPAFQALVQEGQVAAVMGAYNRVYGESASASTLLLEQILRRDWGFQWLRRFRLRLDRRHLQASPDRRHRSASGRARREDRVRPRLREDLRCAVAGGAGGTHQRKRYRRCGHAAHVVALPSRHVRSATSACAGRRFLTRSINRRRTMSCRGAQHDSRSCC